MKLNLKSDVIWLSGAKGLTMLEEAHPENRQAKAIVISILFIESPFTLLLPFFFWLCCSTGYVVSVRGFI